MSNFRRRLIISSIGGGGSWYRVCDGGIYTTTNAYINTGLKGIPETALTVQVDVKVLQTAQTVRRLFGSVGRDVFYYAHFTGASETSIYPHIFAFPGNTKSEVTNIYKQSPFIRKKVRVHMGERLGTMSNFIQIWDGASFGDKIYCPNKFGNHLLYYPLYLFNWNYNGAININQSGNYIVFYEVLIKYNKEINLMHLVPCRLTHNITGDLAWDNKPHYAGEYGMYDDVSGKFFGNANSTGSFIENID